MTRRHLSIIVLALVASAPLARAQEPKPGDPPAGSATPTPTEPAAPTGAAPAAEADREPTPEERAQALKMVKAELGAIEPGTKAAMLGDQATIDVPQGWFLVPKSGAAKWLELTENLPDPDTVGVLVREDLETSVYFGFDAIGYVKDDERDLDADELMTTMRANETRANLERKQRGFGEIELQGFAKKPTYNEKSQSLEWATLLKTKGVADSEVVNFETRRLGRDGVMSIVLVTDPRKLDEDIGLLTGHMASYNFVAGRDYASFKQGDRTAEIGLGALVVGGGVALAAKAGFFAKAWKWLLAGGAAIAGLFAKMFGRKKASSDSPPAGS